MFHQGWFLLEALRGESISLPFSASRGLLHSLAHGPFLPSLQPLATVITSSTTNSYHLPPYCKDPRDHIKPNQIVQNNLLISRSLITISKERNHQFAKHCIVPTFGWHIWKHNWSKSSRVAKICDSAMRDATTLLSSLWK